MSAYVTVDKPNETINIQLTLNDAKSLGEFLWEHGNDPLGKLLLEAAARYDGYGRLVDITSKVPF